ncbi:MAG: lipoate--protein ligase [Candidatus Bathyarchaeota archaeon]|nr:lipoate--protein ligase [Candidatus Bathyarchaeota archaeon]
MGFPEPLIAQTFYESVAEAVERESSPNTLIMLQPGAPYACVGYHQDLEKEIDLDYCRSVGLPIIRRSQGGGATYLDGNQVFYQIIAKNTTAYPTAVDAMFQRLLAVTVETYKRLGVPAEFKPLNDVVVNGKKISGNGASVNGSTSIMVGNFILDMNYDMMARVLRVPDEKFRDKMAKSMRDWVSSLKRELPHPPSGEEVKRVYSKTFQELLGVKLTKQEPTQEEWRIYESETKPRNLSHEWLYMEAPYSSRKPGRAVKIAHEVKIIEADHKAGKLIRVRVEMRGEKILDIRITGDFFSIPKEAIFHLEDSLRGKRLDEETLRLVIERFYMTEKPEMPGVGPEDIIQALLKIRALL